MTDRPTIEPVNINSTSTRSSDETMVSPTTAQAQAVQPARPPSTPTTEVATFEATSFEVQQQRQSLMDSLKGFTSRLAQALEKAAEDITSLEVSTYTSSDIDGVKYDLENKKMTGEVKLRAYTHIAFDGDTQIALPDKAGSIDEAVWNIHIQMVKEAQANRAAFLQTMAEMATKLVGLLK